METAEEMQLTIKTVKTRKQHFFHLGPPMCLIHFAQSMTVTVLTDLIVYRTCLVSLNIDAAECLILRENPGSHNIRHLEIQIEPYASVIVMCIFLMRSILPAIASLIFGSWSDRGGRRPLFLGSILGMTLMFGSFTLISYWNISPWYLLLATMPADIIGGMYVLKLAFVCHISDTAIDKDRTLQMAYLEGAFYGGYVVGGLIGPSIYNNYGYVGSFSSATVCCIVALIYSYFLIPETVENASKESIRSILKLSFVKKLIASSIVERQGFNRPLVWLAITCLTLNSLVWKGDNTIKVLFTRARLGWDVQQFSFYNALDFVSRILGLCGLYFINSVSTASETVLANISFLSGLCCAITKSLVWKGWHIYLSACIGILNGITTPVLRSIIAKFVPAEDVGKVFSLTSILDVMSAIAGSSLYTLIYSNYLPPIYPSPVFLVSVACFLTSIMLVSCMEVLIRNPHKPSSYTAAQ